MPLELDREGTFKAIITDWYVKRSESSDSIAVSCRFAVRAQKNEEDGTWEDWSAFEEHVFGGDYWVVGKDGGINEMAVEQLVRSAGWDGKLESVRSGLPKIPVVQVVVKANTYKDRTTYKAAWMYPENYVGGKAGAVEGSDEVRQLDNRYGSLLRASASSVKVPGAEKPAPAAKAKRPPPAKARKVDEAMAPVGTGEEVHGAVERDANDPGNQDSTPF
jgi:hypothetical protein